MTTVALVLSALAIGYGAGWYAFRAEVRARRETKGGYPAGDKPASQIAPPPPAMTSSDYCGPEHMPCHGRPYIGGRCPDCGVNYPPPGRPHATSAMARALLPHI